MNIRFVRNRHHIRTVLGEMHDVPSSELPEVNDAIVFDGDWERVLTVTKSYEPVSDTELICWFEVDIT